MYGEKEIAKIAPSMNPITGINMKRMLARIDIRNSASNFMVEEVYLANYNTTGYIAPAWDADGKVGDPASDVLNLPADGGKRRMKGMQSFIPWVETHPITERFIHSRHLLQWMPVVWDKMEL